MAIQKTKRKIIGEELTSDDVLKSRTLIRKGLQKSFLTYIVKSQLGVTNG